MKKIDRTNAALAGLVFLISFIVYALTVQRSFSFWDCGEFIACSYILGIPHPPGTPLFVLLGRIFSIIPFVEDISYRVNYLSVVSSAVTAMLSYLLVARMVRYFTKDAEENPLSRFIGYAGGLAGGFFVAFSQTNWGNSVEAEVYGLALALMVGMFYLTLRYFETKDLSHAGRILVLIFYLGLVGIGVHMTVYLVMPACAIFFVLKKDSLPRDWAILCGFGILELLYILLFADGRGGAQAFYFATAVTGIVVLILLYRKINWGIVIAFACLSTVMMSFSLFMKAAPAGIVILVILAFLAKRFGWQVQWKTALAIMVIGIIGFSTHLFIPIRSELNPRIDENNPSRDFRTFVNFLDRKQYGQQSMVDRMFQRRGKMENQFGRHPHMGFWSYFEEQYSSARWGFAPFFVLGLIGMYVAIRKRLELGLPFFTLFLLCSVGLILYMNFADGTQYNPRTTDAYLEVRNRDYFFTPAFVFFGIAMGLGVAGIMQLARERLAGQGEQIRKYAVYGLSVLVLLPTISLAKNYHINDRSQNILPLVYSKNILDTCDENAILFTSGDNDTFPVWCLQEVYEYRKDVRVVNLSLLNTDWYVAQMKNHYDVPISLTDEQILWYPFEYRPGLVGQRPKVPFHDRPRGMRTYLSAYAHEGQTIRVQDMMVDEIVIENRWQVPIYFSSAPYAHSPLKLREHASAVGILYRLDRDPVPGNFDVEKTYELFKNNYTFTGMETPDIFRDDNATGVFLSEGSRAVSLYEELKRRGDTARAQEIIDKVISEYPEFSQAWVLLADQVEKDGDSARAMELRWQLHDTLTAFLESNEGNLVYMQDLGSTKLDLGRITGDSALVEEGLKLLWDGYVGNKNSAFAYRKLVVALYQEGRTSELTQATNMIAEYGRNMEDPYVQQLVNMVNRNIPAPQSP